LISRTRPSGGKISAPNCKEVAVGTRQGRLDTHGAIPHAHDVQANAIAPPRAALAVATAAASCGSTEKRAMDGFEGKIALITGGAGGIGSMVCEALLENGCRVVLHDLPSSDGEAKARALRRRFGDERAIFAPGDLSDLARLKRDSEALAAEVGGFDFLVNNAAIDPVAPVEAYSIKEFLAVQTINAHAAFILCQTLAPHMKRKGAGAIVNVMSVILSGGWSEKVPYAMSKGALLGLTRSLARELGPHNIRVNAVSPGAIPTQLEHKHYGDDRAGFEQRMIKMQSLPFRSDIRDVADAALYLLSPLSRFITGQELHVNGGMYMG
jgi:NAD(P)-dependent dehydrogenase (short-subunit alcohol dehydrogenase family)